VRDYTQIAFLCSSFLEGKNFFSFEHWKISLGKLKENFFSHIQKSKKERKFERNFFRFFLFLILKILVNKQINIFFVTKSFFKKKFFPLVFGFLEEISMIKSLSPLHSLLIEKLEIYL